MSFNLISEHRNDHFASWAHRVAEIDGSGSARVSIEPKISFKWALSPCVSNDAKCGLSSG